MHAGVHLLDKIGELAVRLAVPAGFEVVDLALGVYDEDLVQLDSHIAVAHCVSVAVAEPTVKRLRVRRKQVLYGLETRDFEDLGFLLYNFAVEGPHESVGAHDDGSFGQAVAALAQASDVRSRRVGLPDGARSEVKDLVAVGRNSGEKLCNAGVRPVVAEAWEHVAKHVALGDGAVHVGYHDLGGVIVEIDFAVDPRGALERANDFERDFVDTFFELKQFQLRRGGRVCPSKDLAFSLVFFQLHEFGISICDLTV